MYIPTANAETRLPVLHDLLRTHPLASLVTLNASGLIATHLPLVLTDDGSDFGLLQGHISRANTQWRDLTPTTDALAIFSGPQHYITPSWYPMKQDTGKVVPTWNYCVVHAYGPIRLIEDPTWLLAHLKTLTNLHEATFPTPWQVEDAPADFITALLNGIIGLEIPIRRPEGKWKLSQNRNTADRAGVASGLSTLNTPGSSAMQHLIEEAE
jgi:transcriptional regulator